MSNYAKIKHSIPIKDFDNKAIIIDKKRVGKRTKLLVKCPHCGCERWINKDHLNRVNHTLCMNCTRRSITLFYIDKELDCAYFYVKDGDSFIKVLVDYEDADRLFGCNFGVSGDEKYISIINGLGTDKRVKLTSFILEHDFNEQKYVPDHINHNIYDNRKQNLVIVPQTLNQGNKGLQQNNSTGFRGIHWETKSEKWCVQVRYKRKFVAKKRFVNFTDAYNYWYDIYHCYFKEHAYNILNDKTKRLKYAGVKHFEIENGNGIGYTLFTQGCYNHCIGCHNPQTWDFDGGMEYTQDVFDDMVRFFEDYPLVKRLTLSGGDPLQNLELSNYVAAEFKRLFPKHKLWVYTGLLYEDIKDDIKYKALLELTDVLVDGRFEIEQRNISLAFKGSDNQRLIDMPKTLEQGEVVFYG